MVQSKLSHGCSSENDDYGDNYDAATDDMYDCHDRASGPSKPHEMVAFMCYRKISDRNLGLGHLI